MKIATEICKCIPWDFIQNSKANECDVFGRTCFYNTMKNLTKFPENFCKQCIEECDYIKFNKQIIKEEKFADISNKKWKFQYWKNVIPSNTRKCFGSKVRIIFIVLCLL